MDSNLPVHRIIPVKHVKHLDWLLNRVDEYLSLKSDNFTPNDILASISYKIREWEKEQKLKEQLDIEDLLEDIGR